MKRRGHRAIFPAIDESEPEILGPTLTHQSGLCFSVVVDGGTLKVFDFTEWQYPSLTSSVMPLVLEMVRRMGPAPVANTLRNKILRLRRFWTFLADCGHALETISNVTVPLLDRYEDWLEQHTPNGSTHRQVLSSLIDVLRLAADMEPEQLPVSLRARLRYLSHVEASGIRPRDAYSGCVAAALRTAAEKQIAEARDRIALDDIFLKRPLTVEAHAALHTPYDDALACIVRDEWVSMTDLLGQRVWRKAWRDGIAISEEALHGRLYLTRTDAAGFLILLSLQTGIEIECLRSLQADCLCNPSQGYVEIDYRKRRSHGVQWKRLRVRDGASSTPGAIIRTLIKLTARARVKLGSDRLFIWWNGYRLVTPHQRCYEIARFIARHRIVDDDGAPLHLLLSRLRKTQKAEHYIRTGGQLEDFATGHTVAVAARHYADIPALRHIHEQTVADAFKVALDVALKPTLIPHENESLDVQVGADVDDDSSIGTATLTMGKQDVWLAACSNFYDGPFNSVTGCTSPFWGCLECSNAVITARKLPALIAFEAFLVDQRATMTESEWRTKFGRAYHRINAQIIPAFPNSVVAEAKSLAAAAGGKLVLPTPRGLHMSGWIAEHDKSVRSRYRADDDLILRSMPLRPGMEGMATSRFCDDSWDLRPAVFQTRARYVPKAIEFGTINCPIERLTAKEYIYAWLNERLPDRMRRLPPLSVPKELNSLVRFMDFVRERLHSFNISGINQDLIDDYRLLLLKTSRPGSESILRNLRPILQLHRFAPYLTYGGLPEPPWGGRPLGTVVGLRERDAENRTARIPEPVMAAMLTWCLKYVNVFADDIFAARAEWDELLEIHRQRLIGRRNATERVATWIKVRRDQGRGIPVWTETPHVAAAYKGVRPKFECGDDVVNIQLISLQCGLSHGSIYGNEKVRQLLNTALNQLGSERGGMDTPISVDPDTNAPWRGRFDIVSLGKEEKYLQTAAYILCAYLTGMRDSEVQAMAPGCLRRTRSADGLVERISINSLIFKQRSARGKPGEWITIEPVGRALQVAEKLAERYRDAKGKEDLWIGLDARSRAPARGMGNILRQLNSFRAHLDNQYGEHAAPVIPQVDGRSWWFTTVQFRRTVAWYIANRPFGAVAGKIQYKHASVAMFEGYAGSSPSGFVRRSSSSAC